MPSPTSPAPLHEAPAALNLTLVASGGQAPTPPTGHLTLATTGGVTIATHLHCPHPCADPGPHHGELAKYKAEGCRCTPCTRANTAPNTPAALAETMLRDVFRQSIGADDAINHRLHFDAHIHASANAYIAHSLLAALVETAPDVAAQVVQAIADELDNGNLTGFAWHAATNAGHNPDEWITNLRDELAKRKAHLARRATTTA